MSEIVRSDSTLNDGLWRGFRLGGETPLPVQEAEKPEISPRELVYCVNNILTIYGDRGPHADPDRLMTPIITLDTGAHLIVSAKINHLQRCREDPVIAVVDPDKNISRCVLDFTGEQIVDGAGREIVEQKYLEGVVELLNEIDRAAYQGLTGRLNAEYPVIDIVGGNVVIEQDTPIGIIQVTSTPRNSYHDMRPHELHPTTAIGRGETFSEALENAINSLKASMYGEEIRDADLDVTQFTAGSYKTAEIDNGLLPVLTRLSQKSPVGSIANPRARE